MPESIERKAAPGMQVFNAAELQHRESANFSRVYTNSANFGINFFDISISFGEMVAGTGDPFIEDRVVVTMTFEHARALANSLQLAIANYEKTNGPVRTAPIKADLPALEG